MEFNDLISKLKNKENFSFTRWGDGEWSSLLQLEPEHRTNTDGHAYFKDMGEALANVLKSKPEYYLGMQRLAREDRFPNEIKQFLDNNDLNNLQWINADIWHHASIKGYFEEFFEALSNRRVFIVGPLVLGELEEMYEHYHSSWKHIIIGSNNCWLQRDSIIQEVTELIKGSNNCVVLFCASMPANYMIDELYKQFEHQHTFLDLGSVLMPYVGISSRSYHKKIIERLGK